MTDLMQRLSAAIFRQEGHSSDHPNPGSLRECPWFTGSPAFGQTPPMRWYDAAHTQPVKYDRGFWVPRTRAEGEAGAMHVIALHVAQGNSLRKLIGIWAPPSENDTEAYIANVSKWANIPNTEIPLWTYLVQSNEGAAT